jgi:PIN domain nuclease of toxin-antitoxin system
MRYLLDTHTFLWFINDDKQLSKIAVNAMGNSDATKFLSIVSLWEIAIKLNIGKLQLNISFPDLEQQMHKNGFELLPVTFVHTHKICTLDKHHGDPFDRMIIAQALSEELTVISKDKNFTKYSGLQLLW